jgi:hypothetical protein
MSLHGTETNLPLIAVYLQSMVFRVVTPQETFLRTVLNNEGNCWTEFYKYVKRRKENKEN